MTGLPGPDWRAILARHANALFSATCQGKGSAGLPPLGDDDRARLGGALGQIADEALRIVENFAIGAATRVDADATDPADQDKRFEAQLGIVLNGLVPLQAEADFQKESVPPQIIQVELWQVLQMARESAELSYARETDLVELDRRILLMLSDNGLLVPADISSSAGVDKAQVSRSVKRLLELKMVHRSQIRAPLTLTRKGQSISDRLNKLAELRNRELTFGVGDPELETFFQILEKLLKRAVLLYEQERARGGKPDLVQEAKIVRSIEGTSNAAHVPLNRRRILAPMLTLSAYFSRSSSLTYKRLTRLSSFEARVLNEIGISPPIAWSELVSRLDRDHSQAGRTVNSLVERGLVTRDGKPGRRHGRFSPTAEGMEMFRIIQEAARQRSTFLMAPLSPEERQRFLDTFEMIRRNATVQLERERAFEEIERA